ncbi:hypothetical protein [Gloeothece verrucosa]|uniref:Lipoprotein n=1 Tax=Gloeothece verrucosa (strain PCC 7822) TaxID=497965 RepID=E0UMB6_GLOV7|nr:hypothetical protein [Gloeothece verrucosa]ADN18096.1 hypothetical protein Cyan7822_6296 [Gloeothece verrucosa PCC 7822]
MIKKILLTTTVLLLSSCVDTKELASSPAKNNNQANFYSIRWKYCVSNEEIQKLGFYPFLREQPDNCWTARVALIVWGNDLPEVELWKLPSTGDSMLNPVKYDNYVLVFRGRGCPGYYPQPSRVGWYQGDTIVTFNRQYTNQIPQIKVTALDVQQVNLSKKDYEDRVWKDITPGIAKCEFIRENRNPNAT